MRPSKKTLVLLDAHAIIHRAYHALPEFTSKKGEPTGALYGIVAMLLKIIKDLSPDYIIAAYDLPGPTFRHVAYEGYKATRQKTDEALVAQIIRSRDIFNAFNIPIYEAPGFEADDVLGTIVEQVTKNEFGYDDDHALIPKLKPLNPYGASKNEFDQWVLKQSSAPFFWAGLKFFNVYGPNEYHKGRMASVIYHAFNQVREKGEVKLFRSHKPEYNDGEQLRDFVYVKDLCKVCMWFMVTRKHPAIYNLGSGKARTFLHLTRDTFKAMGKEEHITFIDTPIDIRDKYQYYTEARMEKLRTAGYDKPFHSLEEGVADYVGNYLLKAAYC